MKKTEAVQFFGSQQALADVLKLHKSAISQWGEIIPELRALQLENITGGKLKACRPYISKRRGQSKCGCRKES
ncbi:Cro/CI family transcriptional regulator [Hahella sp. HN01]|uniref:Cro/CI family transcriptional regulator n=1 Tax=Hahella sp. HN01 TaxID=2847262 RepID=UPI001C1EAC47|nr:Cro/Cl family transcriptional regulator [Hahella sp. HN01]